MSESAQFSLIAGLGMRIAHRNSITSYENTAGSIGVNKV